MKSAWIATITAFLAACTPVGEQASTSVAASSSDLEGAALFVANKFGNTLSKIDLGSGAEVKRVDSCKNPHELSASPSGEHVALACYGGTTIDIFRTDDLVRVKSIELGDNARPHGIVWHANGSLYATAEGQKRVYWIRRPLARDANPLGFATGKDGSHMLAISPDGRHAWTTDLGSKTVTLVDLVTRRAPLSVEVGVEPEGIALSPDGTALWVSARGSNKAFDLDPENLEIRREVATGAFPLRLAIRPQGDVAVTSDLADGGLTVIDLATAKPVRSIAVSSAEEARARLQVTILWSDDGERIYVAETGSDTIAEVDYASGTVLRRLQAGDGGDGLAILGGR
ncbi:YncE family protein [Pontixanthobacter aestiaquae]|uniref:YncE family protein n=1 Tax=Pontixanthobacter aestiaquae TaxID=1509367 RepID=A0A844Z7E0_9SPHN|nr:YncE family protein [Pontixanthobacter aestiaquae]MDN3645175.1 YncE family protein [Pontixanthobacter aestiaquae]MXO83825.1 YncE family protein [Pontixanthobacter aestiaquae]